MVDWDKHVTKNAQSNNQDSLEHDSYFSKVPIRQTNHFNILAWCHTNSVEYPTLIHAAIDI
jgi:hypothetical protein